MTAAYYRQQWEKLNSRDRAGEPVRGLATKIATTFLDRHFFHSDFSDDLILLLCEMATSFPDASMNSLTSTVLFKHLIETLCDTFHERDIRAYNRVMCHVISFCRQTDRGKQLNSYLNRFGLEDFDSLSSRGERLRTGSWTQRKLPASPKKVFFLSRVTIGADVAVTSVLVQRTRRLFPNANFVLLGDKQLRDIFGENSGVEVRHVEYKRRGLLERLESWPEILKEIYQEHEEGLEPDFLIVDPDSRQSQLGILPLIGDQRYLLFNCYRSMLHSVTLSISEVANLWFSRVTGIDDFCYPAVWLNRNTLREAKEFCDSLRAKGRRKIVTINFGDGGDARKRVGADFELLLLLELLKEKDVAILLDCGFGSEEMQRTNALVKEITAHGYQTDCLRFENLKNASALPRLIAVQAGIGEISALISGSDEFIGYDSSCQHIAAALDVPAYAIFTGSGTREFVSRWKPFGRKRTHLVLFDSLASSLSLNAETCLTRILDIRSCDAGLLSGRLSKPIG